MIEYAVISNRPRTPASGFRPITSRSAFSSPANWATTLDTSPARHSQRRRITGSSPVTGPSALCASLRAFGFAPAAVDMQQRQFRLVFLGHVARPVEHARAQWLQIHRAQNPPARQHFKGRRLLQVDAGPDRAIRIV